MVYDTYNYSIHGVYKTTNITGGGHIVIIPNPLTHRRFFIPGLIQGLFVAEQQ